MNVVLTVNYNKKPVYNIMLEENYDKIHEILNGIEMKNKKICIVSDSHVSKYYLDDMVSLLKEHAALVTNYVFTAGEESKTLDTVKEVYKHLIHYKFDRNDILFALGGGVVGDLTGYAAATYLRGISFLQLPTSLLSMVDSSIGGKTGVDFDAYKNMVGAFYQPMGVYINLNTLNTLPDKEYYSGLGEIIKHGLIKDKDYYSWLKANIDNIKKKDLATLREMIYRSCIIKKNVVENDFKEQGERALLNFGHTIGHSVEKLMKFKLLHGECVAIGCVAASYLSCQRGYINQKELEDIVTTIKGFNLPTSIHGMKKVDILEATKHDKKMSSGKIKFILLEEIGKAVINDSVTDSEILDALDYITC